MKRFEKKGFKECWKTIYIKEIHVKKEKPQIIYYKYDLRREEYKPITTFQKNQKQEKDSRIHDSKSLHGSSQIKL